MKRAPQGARFVLGCHKENSGGSEQVLPQFPNDQESFMRRIVFSFLALVCGAASAETQSGIPYIAQSSYGSGASNAGYMFLFVTGGAKTGSPACATINGGTRWVINNN
jgi:hypothetical protein